MGLGHPLQSGIRPSTLLSFDNALKNRNYRQPYSSRGSIKPRSNGPLRVPLSRFDFQPSQPVFCVRIRERGVARVVDVQRVIVDCAACDAIFIEAQSRITSPGGSRYWQPLPKEPLPAGLRASRRSG